MPKGTIGWTFEDENDIAPIKAEAFEFSIDYDITPGERMVMYYPDGSGYPGSPTEVELIGFRCDKIDDSKPSNFNATLAAKWFKNYVESNETLRESIYESILDQPEPEQDWDDISD